MGEWRTIDSAPMDGTPIILTWFDRDGDIGDVWLMQWGHIQQNGLFPGVTGMWVTPDGAATWNPDGEGGPTHWRPADEGVMIGDDAQ